MRFLPSARQLILVPALGAAVGMAVAACGSSGGSGSAASSSPSSASPATASASASALGGTSAAKATIAANWTAFFMASTPIARRVALLQNGSVFQPIIKAQANSALASSATAKVTKVTLVSPTQAKVIYSILVGGQPALSNQTGVAVKENGTWKVGDASFCSLLAVENGGKTSLLPPACQSAG